MHLETRLLMALRPTSARFPRKSLRRVMQVTLRRSVATNAPSREADRPGLGGLGDEQAAATGPQVGSPGKVCSVDHLRVGAVLDTFVAEGADDLGASQAEVDRGVLLPFVDEAVDSVSSGVSSRAPANSGKAPPASTD